jgi:hypothetical protein
MKKAHPQTSTQPMVVEALLVVVLLSLGLLPIVALRERDWMHAVGFAAVAVGVGLAVMLPVRFQRTLARKQAAEHRPLPTTEDSFVSSATCRACHPSQYDSWHASYHRTMTQAATPETALGPFDDEELDLGRNKLRLTKHDGRLWAETIDPSAPGRGKAGDDAVPVTLSTGSHHMQFYWAPTGKGREQWLLPYGFLVDDQRWIPRDAVFLRPPQNDWDRETARWNKICIFCHTTHGQPRIADGGKIDSHVAELGIACEACHGPAEQHLQARHNPLARYRDHLTAAADPTIVQPERLSAKLSSQVCGQCHGIHEFRVEAEGNESIHGGLTFRPGNDLETSRIPFRVNEIDKWPQLRNRVRLFKDYVGDLFWPDGMVRVSGREYNGLIESPCFKGGNFSCLSCHVMHKLLDDPRTMHEWANDQLKPFAESDQACLQCHAEVGKDLNSHTHHDVVSTGSRCYNCHMPYTTYGLLKAIRSHQVSSPSVAVDLQTRRLNACNQCHLDKTLDWTADKLESWYGTPKPLLNDEQQKIAGSVLWALEGDAGQRALMAWSMGWPAARAASGEQWMAPYLAQLLVDPYDAVRFIAARSLKRLPGFAKLPYDFVGPANEREAARVEAMKIWNEAHAPLDIAAADSVLIEADGRLQRESFERLLKRRDDRRVFLQE